MNSRVHFKLGYCILVLSLWVGLIILSLVLEWLLNSGTQKGSGGMNVLPIFFVAALFLGWIPAGVLSWLISKKRD